MSKRSDREAALARETERIALFEFDRQMERQAELDRQHREKILAEARNQLAQDKLEAAAVEVENYRLQAVAQAQSSRQVAPQFLPFITGSSREEIDLKVQQAIAATAEIVSELAGQGEPTVQARDERTGQFIPQAPQPIAPGQRGLPQGMTPEEYAAAENGTLDMGTYSRMRDRLNIGNHDAGIFG